MLNPLLTPKSLWSYNPIPRGCVLYLPLWHPGLSGPVFKSVDPFGHTCTVAGALYKGKDGRFFDGDNDKIVVPDHPILSAMPAITAEFWMKSDGDAGVLNGLIGKYDTGQREWLTGLDDDDSYLQMRIYDESVGKYIGRKDTTSNVWDDAWHHVVFTWSGLVASEYIKIYVDGSKTDNADDENIAGWTAIEDGTSDVQIGTRVTDANYYKNYIGEVRLYNRELSLAEIQHNRNCTLWRYL